ncbi:MAG TPA: LamG-like jellyroll fold domain-containing protein [Dongiaceae bacterium]|nr:LamG-like jellyroll fold domain-containing protein [Dongiaceae bacterium]
MADYSNNVMSLAPLAYWRLNETAIPPADVATNIGTLGTSGNGIYAASASHPNSGALATGAGSSAYFPDMAGNRVVVPYQPALATTAPFSVEFWANPNDVQSGDSSTMCPVSLTQFGNPPGAGDGTRKGWLFYQNGGTGWTFRTYGTGNTAFGATANQTVTPGTWYHIVGVYDGTNSILYVNGQPAATVAASSFVPVDTNASPFSVGARGYGALGFFRYNGSVAEVAYYTNILSAAEILSHYQNGLNASPATSYQQLIQAKSPELYLRFAEPSFSADPSTYPVAVNLGSLGTNADGAYQPGSTPGVPGVPYTGITGSNYATGFSPDAGGYINVGAAPELNLTTPFTLITWFKTAPTDARFQTFIGKGDTSWRAGIDGDGHARFAVGSNPDATGTANLNDGQWHQLCGVYDGSSIYLYIDGLLDVSGGATDAIVGSEDYAFIGTVPDYVNDRVFKGSMDEVAVFGSVLTADQIKQLYLSANVPPRITLQPPATLNASEGTAITISANAFGSPTLAYQWQKNGTNLVGQTASNLVFAVTQAGDAGNYDLVVTNAYGAVTSSITALTIQAGPPIELVAPQSQARYAGLSASFSVLAGGSSPLSYQWLYNKGDIAGQTATNLTLTNLQLGQTGDYSVRITNPQGSITSSVATLTVVAAPTSPYAAAVLADSPIGYWRLGETSGATAYDYVGGHSGVYTEVTLGMPGYSATDTNLAAGVGLAATPSLVGGINGIDFATNAGVPSFTIEAWVKAGAQSSDSCVITKGTGAGGEQFNLDYGSGGSFRFFVRDAGGGAHLCNSSIAPDGNWHYLTAVCDGPNQTLTLYIDANQAAQTTISGGIKAAAQPMTIGCRQSGTTAYDLQMSGTVDEVAVYNTALASDAIVTHFTARYVANSKPVIVTPPQPLTNYVGLASTFTVEAGGPDPLSYQWQTNGVNIDGATAATLLLNPLDYSMAGNYRVIVMNDSGAVTSAVVALTVLAPPTNLDLSAGLVLHLPFDGNYADISGHDNNGTNVGATTFDTGKIGSGALHYSTDTGSSSYNYVTLGQRADLNFSSNVDFSLALWVKLPAGLESGDLPFFCNAAGSAFSPGYTFAPSYKLGGWSWTLNGTGIYGTNDTINDGAWHQLVYTFNRTGMGITYLDGNVVDSRSVASVGDITQAAPTSIGQDPTGHYGESGEADIDDLGVWRRVLTPLEASSIYVAGLNGGITFATTPATPATLSITHSGGQVQIIWTGSGTLQSAGTLTGTYTNVPSATSPYVVTPDGTQRFFRLAN